MNIFYSPTAVLNEIVALDETESHHIAKVLRKRENEELYVFDGKGKLFDAVIETITKKEVLVRINRIVQVEEEEKPKLHIAIAPPKNIERFEWFAEKVTEIGVTEISPIVCSRSERKELRADRIKKVLVSACKQSKHLTVPKLNPVLSFNEFVLSINHVNRKYIAFCDEKAIHLKDAYHGGFDAVIMIGPEGDFTREEIQQATQNEFETVSLGKSILRLETAGLYACAVFNVANER